MAYFTLVAQQGFLARMTQTASEGKVPTAQDLRQAEAWADAQVNQFLLETVGARAAPAVIAAFRATPPPEIQALACLLGSAWVWDKYRISETPDKGETEADRLRRRARELEGRIRRTGTVTRADGTLGVLSGRRRGIAVEDPAVRAYPYSAGTESRGRTTRHSLESILREVSAEAPPP